MSIYAGTTLAGIAIAESLYGNQSATTQSIVPPSPGAWSSGVLVSEEGVQTRLNQIVEIDRGGIGHYAGGVNSTFYFRIILDPAVLNLGNLVSAQQRTITMWNGFFENKTVNSVVGVGTEGLTLTEPATAPFDLLPLQVVYYQVAVDTAGPANINATYTFDVDGTDYSLVITGSRVTLWPFGPNWNSRVEESLEWLTDITRSYSGDEQRVVLRSKARRRLEYRFALFGEDTQRYQWIVWGWQNRAFAVPYWQYGAVTSGIVSAGTKVIPVNTAGTGFAVGDIAVIFSSADVYEVFEVEAVTGSSVTAKLEVSFTWPSGTKIYPAMTAFVEGNIATTQLTDDKLIGNVRFLANPVVNSPYTPDTVAPDTYRSTEIILKQPDWQSGLTNASEYPSDVVDRRVGARSQFVTNDTPILYRTYAWLLKSRIEAEEFRAFLQRRKGRAKVVWIPSWTDDVDLAEPVNINDSILKIVDRGFFNMVGYDLSKRDIMIRNRSGQHVVRRIISVGKTSTSTDLGLDAPIPFAIPLDQFKAAHFVSLWRLSSDTVVLQWYSDQVARVEAMFQVVKA